MGLHLLLVTALFLDPVVGERASLAWTAEVEGGVGKATDCGYDD